MLSYELCKKLKETGFSQEISKDTPILRSGSNFWSGNTPDSLCFLSPSFDNNLGLREHRQQRYFKIPTLSELIDACGNEFKELATLSRKSGVIIEWCAYRFSNFLQTQGNTPEEAVANLYLALHEKV